MNKTWEWQTASAPAAIGLIHVPAITSLFDRPLPVIGQARFACLRNKKGQVIDEVVVTRLSEERLEIACHGGPGMRAAVEAACASHGLYAAESGRTHETALWQALAKASSPAAVDWLLAQGLTEPPFPKQFLFRLPTVLITGPANAGKSTLLNAWCGHQRALVSDIPGTTRDLLAGQTLVYGWRLALIDSAGLRPDGDAIEQAGQALVANARKTADVVLYLQPPGDHGGEPNDIIILGKADLRSSQTGLRWSAQGIPGKSAQALLQELALAVLNRLRLPISRDIAS
jgi:tRNA U34 5-carboxymethylaminomethyl modifying GTPase MnmE/TrmE